MRQAGLKDKEDEHKEQTLPGNIMDIDEVIVDEGTEEERDKKLFEKISAKGLVSIEALVMKNPEVRSQKDIEYLILYMKHKFPVFASVSKPAIKMFIRRLTVAMYKTGDVISKRGEECKRMMMVMAGSVDSRNESNTDESVDLTSLNRSGDEGGRLIKILTEGMSFGEQSFDTKEYKYPLDLVCRERAFVLFLNKKDFSEVLY